MTTAQIKYWENLYYEDKIKELIELYYKKHKEAWGKWEYDTRWFDSLDNSEKIEFRHAFDVSSTLLKVIRDLEKLIGDK